MKTPITIVLENGLGEASPLWDALAAKVARTTRVCAYDRAGQGWSDDTAHPQDGHAVAADLHTLLARAGESGAYVLAGHSSGGTYAMTYAAGYPDQVAGLVLLDSSSPQQYTALPDFARTYPLMRRLLPVISTLARLGALHLAPPPAPTALTPFATSPRGARNMAEQSQLRDLFTQAQALTTFDPKPVAVVTSRENADTTHVGLLDDTAGTADSVRAIRSVVTAVRTGSPLAVR